jgi:U3 small nucleolar RNA-associated protein 6
MIDAPGALSTNLRTLRNKLSVRPAEPRSKSWHDLNPNLLPKRDAIPLDIVVNMAAASDKARYYLEQYVPELQEYERKGIFSKEEISSIASKRSDFEHVLNARGSKPSDYARYATYEMNLDSLRKKRCKRLGVKSTTFSGQRTLFFIFDRATKKFPGDLGLWMQYINYCQREKANKKLARVFTDVLRLKPREWNLWILAAKHYAESQGDMGTARSYLQRGLRFCKDEKKLWLEYIRLEMIYLAKLAARRKVLGVDEHQNESIMNGSDEDGDMLMLPIVTAEDINPNTSKGGEDADADALQMLVSAPAFTGALPKALFDAAMKQFNDDAQFADEIFDLCASFVNVSSTASILQHIVDHLQTTSTESAESAICAAKLELLGIQTLSAEFPEALGRSLALIRVAQERMSDKDSSMLVVKATMKILPYLKLKEELDKDVLVALEATLRRYLRQLSQTSSSRAGTQMQDALTGLLIRLGKDGRDADVELLKEYANPPEIG